jgi:hypothetical protein
MERSPEALLFQGVAEAHQVRAGGQLLPGAGLDK